jgi:hypothetical protein
MSELSKRQCSRSRKRARSNVMLVAELTRCGCSMLDLFDTLQDLQKWGVSSIARTGLQFGCVSAQG